ncbi:TM2 domain-containing protein [Arthrobacter globiformis]|uniref:TM2 domain-containing protein n=1 Tax=Arthrobacter globiformis TaxID=1665 RepID=UPI002780EA51|nr:TM2 domain-containing protein [Arthrobacter globiformis]MDQ0863686.1 TM2 domain-containing membrane protein YozV [Arthrobacter globiformis]
MTQSNSEQPWAPSQANAPETEQTPTPGASQQAWNPSAGIPAPVTPPVPLNPAQPPMPGQQQSLPTPGQYQQQPPATAQYQNYPPAPPQYQVPVAPQQLQSQQPQMSQQPPMPNPVYAYPQPKSKLAAGLLGIFLGGLGIHRFYLGYTTIGIVQLLLTVFLGVFTFGLVGLWGFVEGIMILAGANYFRQDAKGMPLRD